MKKSVKITCVVAASCIVLGLLILLGVSVKFGFDYRNLNTTTAEVKTYAVEQAFENIDIHSLSNNVKFSVADGEQCKVVCTETARTACTVSVENGTLIVTQKDTRRWYENFGMYWASDDTSEMKIELFLPLQEYRDLSVNTQSGDIFVGEPFIFETADLSATSGNISFGSAVNNISLHSTSGNITCQKISMATSIKAETTSGNVDLSKISTVDLSARTTSGNLNLFEIYATGDVVLESNSGIVRLEEATAKSFAITTTSGDIRFKDADADVLRVQSNSGCVTGNLLSEKNFEVSTTSGDVDIPHPARYNKSAGVCTVKTTSGDISLHTP